MIATDEHPTPAVRERPILFSAPMVRAILDGRKTQTRLVVRDSGEFRDWDAKPADAYDVIVAADRGSAAFLVAGDHGFTDMIPCPYGAPGDRLWVRETWYDDNALRHTESTPTAPDEFLYYRADGEAHQQFPEGFEGSQNIWRPSTHMPRWASRILLDVTDVRVERLQAITEEDAEAEGVDRIVAKVPTHRDAFRLLWDQINGERAPWASNPWVWVVSFRRVEG